MVGSAQSSALKMGTAFPVKVFSIRALFSRFMQKTACLLPLNRLFRANIPVGLIYVPFDMHLADPKLAHEFYHGRFPLGGRIVQAGSVSPFMIEPPSREWEAALQDFSWLNHMKAAETELADAHARALTLDWLENDGKKPKGRAWAAGIAARRLCAWLAHADMLLTNAPPQFRKRFLKAVGLHMRYLSIAFAGERDAVSRLLIAVALAMAALVAPKRGKRRTQRGIALSMKRLEAELARQILPDGGHISRNPAALLELSAYLIPLKEACLQCRQAPPPFLMAAIDRMLPALRFFRHCDGSAANFNGVGPILAQRLDIVLNADETAGIPFSYAPHSGYQRLCAGETVVLADIGSPFAKALTATANAGCLSFEMSSGLQRFIVNCGIDPYGPPEFRFFGRLTAAHSTAVIADTSSCRFADSENPQSRFSGALPNVQTARIEEGDIQGFAAVHDGYKKPFNLLHERTMTLSGDGNVIQGCDRFFAAKEALPASAGGRRRAQQKENGESRTAPQIAVRFHIHPDIKVYHEGEETDLTTGIIYNSVRLQGEYGESWLFLSDCPVRLEDSIYFSGLGGSAKTRQLVLNFTADERDRVQWCLRRELL